MTSVAGQLFTTFTVLCCGAVVVFLIAPRSAIDFDQKKKRVMLGAGLGLISFMVVMNPIAGPLGSSFDMRAAPVIMASFWGGPISGLIAATLGAIARYTIGGPYIESGVLGLFIYAAAGLVAVRWAPKRRRVGAIGWMVIGAGATILATPMFFIGRPFDASLAALSSYWSTLLAANVIGVTVLGLLMEKMRKLLERSLSHADDLKIALEAQRRSTRDMEGILYAVTHDLKSPIVTVRGFAGVIDQAAATEDWATVKDGVGRILRASERMGDMTDGLMQYGSLAAKQGSGSIVDLADLIPRACEMLSAEISNAGATVTTSTPLPTISGSQDDILRVVLNLIANAVKHGCPTPGMPVEISVERTDEGWVLAVADHGPGIDESLHVEAFRLFRRLGRQESQGSGLGLAIVEKIAGGFGGWCAIAQTPGGGATLRVLIAPTARAAALFRKDNAA